MTTITDPNLFARRLSRDAMHGWVVFHCDHEDDVAIRLGRYPVSHVGRGNMKLDIEMPSDFGVLFGCNRISVLSRKMQPLQSFSVQGQVTKEVKSITWIP